MKNVLTFILVSIAAVGILVSIKYFFPGISSATGPKSTTKTTPCTLSQLEPVMNTDVAAGNAYTTLTIKNTSDKPCTVIGNNQLQVQYPNSVTNFKTEVKKAPTTEVFTLAPNQTIYSLIHFPNGPQCSSEATDVNSMVSYAISSTETISFKPTTGNTLDIPSCGKETDITMIDLYSFSDKEVLP